MHRVVPELIVDNYRAGHYSGEFPAVGMFLDLSGFSTMTDALMQHGQHGAEVLAGLMHGVFDPLVESIFDYGGKIIGFAGDGIMALFPIEENAQSTALRAVASAYGIQQRLAKNPDRQTLYGTFPISVRIGLTIGAVSWGILGSSDGEDACYYFRGTAVDEAADAEHYASPGDILLTAPLAKLLDAQILMVPYASYERLDGFRVALPDPTPIRFPPVDLQVSRHFMPEEVIAQDARGEFRQVVNLFIRFPDLSHDALQNLMTVIFRLRKQYGGLVSRLDFGDKGCNMLMLWGAPVAYENDIGRALNFIMALKSKVDFPITAGVTYYISHAGYLGSVLYEDYTCYGWGVNLASRFMMGAELGEVWVDDRIARRVARRFEFEFIGSQRFKGFAERQKVHLLRGYKLAAEVVYQGELVGREQELAQLARFAEPLWRHRFAGLMFVSGDAGIGKGRLVHEFRLSELFERNKVLWAVCQSNQILRQSFNPLRSSLLRYFGITPNQSHDERRQAFDAKLDDLRAATLDPALVRELDRTRSILAGLVEISWPGSLYEKLDAEGRYNNTFLALITLLKAESLRQPVVVFLEDFQFTDADTKELLSRLKRAILAAQDVYPIALIVTSRPQSSPLDADLIDARIELRGLSQTAMIRLLETSLGGNVAPELVRLVMDRSEGNPYFAEQFLRYLQEENSLEMSEAGWTLIKGMNRELVPGDIQAVLVARLDQLVREVREVVQTASVLGREFELAVLVQMLQEEKSVRAWVGEAEKAAIWSPLNESRYIFSHGLLRDAAYAMQMQARRRELHAFAIEALERLYSSDLKSRYAELGYHAELAQVRQKAQQYYILAGKVASDLYQNSQAIEYYTRALAHTLTDDLDAKFRLIAERVVLFHRIGQRTLQSQDLDSLEALASQLGKPSYLAKAKMLHAQYCFITGDYPGTISMSEEVIKLSRDTGETALALGVYPVWSHALLRYGRLEDAIQHAVDGLELARKTGSRVEEGKALTSLGLIALESKEPALAQGYLEEAVAIARETKERTLESRAIANLANSAAYIQKDYGLARAYYEQAKSLNAELGDRYAEGIALGNIGWVCGMLGDAAAARGHHEQTLIIAREIGNVHQETYTLMNLSRVAEAEGNVHEALKHASQALELARRAGDRTGEAWACLYLGHAYLLSTQYEDAQTAFQLALHIRRELGQSNRAAEPIAGLVEAALGRNDLSNAVPLVEELLLALSEPAALDAMEEPLRVYLACYKALEQSEDPRAASTLDQARQLLEEQVLKLHDEQSRRMYIDNVPWRRAIEQAWLYQNRNFQTKS